MVYPSVGGNVHEAFAARKGAQYATIKTDAVVNASGGVPLLGGRHAAATFSNCGDTLKSVNTAAWREKKKKKRQAQQSG